jgi:hypothetical protein
MDPLTPVIEHLREPVEEPVERRGSDPLTELMDRSEMRYFIEVDLLSECVHDFSKFTCVSVIF